MIRLYDAENYFERFDALFIEGQAPPGLGQDGLAPQESLRDYLKLQS